LFGNEDIPAAICIAMPVLRTMLPHQLRRRAIKGMIKRMERERTGLGPEFRDLATDGTPPTTQVQEISRHKSLLFTMQ
jgi:hypothetical protein